MKANFFALTRALLFVILIIPGCQKEMKQTSADLLVQNNIKADNGNTIRLASLFSDFGNESYEYNEDGLVSMRTQSQINAIIHHEYTPEGRLNRAFVYTDDVLTNTIQFFYEKNNVIKEIWYDGSTTNVVDELMYTFDGNVPSHAVSIIGDYRINYTFDSQQNLTESTLWLSGALLVKITYTYGHHLKNPFSAIPGLAHDYLFLNGFFNLNKWYSTSENFTLYDAEGNIVFESTQDPDKTIVEAGPQNYVFKSDFFDESTSSFVKIQFNYENCGACEGHKIAAGSNKSTKAVVQKFLAKGSKKPMTEKVSDLRKYLGR